VTLVIVGALLILALPAIAVFASERYAGRRFGPTPAAAVFVLLGGLALLAYLSR
jgi:hypothetical protein